MRASVLTALLLAAACVRSETIVVGSKNFAENYVLAEIAAQLLEHHDYDVERRLGLNGTKIVFEALSNRAVDLYPEYTGTITEVILAEPDLRTYDEIRDRLESRGFRLLPPLGFNNSYGIAVTESFAAEHGIQTISDLRNRSDLAISVPHEFLNRADGWPGLKTAYGLDMTADGIEHALAYEAIALNEIDVTAVYTTDGEIERTGLKVLEDDRRYFPTYLAGYILHEDVPDDVRSLLTTLSGRIDEARMREMNLAVLQPGTGFAEVASAFLVEEGLMPQEAAVATFWSGLGRNIQRHLKLTGIALGLAIVFGVGLAVVVHRSRLLSGLFLQFTGLMQTIPSIALLALLIPLVGVGQTPAIIALFLYSLLPIARNTVTAIDAIPAGYRQVAAAMAMTRRQELRYVLMPLAMPHMIAGIRTAAIICIGTATLAAFIGAGGLGDPIVTGLALNDSGLILQGAIPAALLAIATELSFGLVERVLVPAHMRSGAR
ncbi:MAG: glycine betaine ABC transporter substrate-binding protein [Woeseiaceae bacterium]|nr:glycine betaine ABC transporter substrate-binding protein [Woeseiaceae bacterium]